MEFKISKKEVVPRPADPVLFKVSECLVCKDPVLELCSQANSRIYSEGGSIEKLGDTTRTVYFIGLFYGEILNGGLHQYFCNSSGNFFRETVLALKSVHASISLSILEEAINLLGLDEIALKNRMDRYEAMERRNLSSELDRLDGIYYDNVGSFPHDPAEPENLWMLCHSLMEQHSEESIDRC